jgi:LysM repeat protein
MSQSLVFILLLLALVLPLLGAIVLRLLAPRLTPAPLYGAAALIFAVAVVSVLMLARSNISSLQVGGLSLLLPVSGPDDQNIALPELPDVPGLVAATPTAAGVPTAAISAPAVTATAGLNLTPTQAPAQAPPTTVATAIPPTEAPTVAPPTEAPTVAPPTEAPTVAPSGPRTYTVQPGDTLRSIAAQFNVGVQAIIDANKLTPAQADSLRVGQVLVIP